MNKKIKFLVIVLVILFVGSVLKNGIFQWVLGSALSKAAHVPVRIGSTQVRFLSSGITLKGIKVYNPRSFPERLMVDAPLVAIDFDPSALFKNQLHFKDVKLNIKEVIVIKNRDGNLNVNAMKPTQEDKAKSKKREPKSKMPALQIDRLSLTVGRVVYKDYSAGGEPAVQVFDVNIQDRVYTNIQNPTVLVSLIMSEALTRTALSRLANLDIDSFTDITDQATGLVGGGADSMESAAKSILNMFS